MKIDITSEAYNTGYAAAENGESISDCPYAAGTWEEENWLAGWEDATSTHEE